MSLADFSPNRPAAGDDEQWAPLSDLMAALMLIFMFIAILFVRTIVQSEETYKAECDKILASFETEFGSDFEKWDVELLNDLTIRFRNPDILFESGRADVRPHFLAILQSFFPRYLSIARHHAQTDEVREIRIEGHTSSAWVGAKSADDAYFRNMALSQDRTRSILQFVMDLPLAPRLTEWAKPLITANGLSSSKLVMNKEGWEDAARSRRVEFRLITAACQKAGVYEDEAHAVPH